MATAIHDVDTQKERVVLPGVHHGHTTHGPFDERMAIADDVLYVNRWCIKCGETWLAKVKDKAVIEFVRIREQLD